MLILNKIKVTPSIFPDKTSQVWKLPDNLIEEENLIEWDFECESEIMHLAQLKMLVDSMGSKSTKLVISYLPYGRQDKEVSNHTTFALVVFAQILNNMHFTKVIIIDPHSKVALDHIRNSHAVYPILSLSIALTKSNSDLIIYPDKGALSKYTEAYFELDYPCGAATKVRNQQTGEIEGQTLNCDVFGLRVMIVDDICDGGATFCGLAKLLFQKGASSVSLFVSHGLFTKTTQPLQDAGISQIYANGEGRIV